MKRGEISTGFFLSLFGKAKSRCRVPYHSRQINPFDGPVFEEEVSLAV